MPAREPRDGARAAPRLPGVAPRGEWLALAALVIVLILLLDLTGVLSRPNRLMQDAWTRLQTRDVGHDVVIVAIDDTSLAALGQWPWPRSLHAELIDRISPAQPRAIGLDMLLLDPSGNREADARLADSLLRSGKVVLPMLMQSVDGAARPVLPLPMFAQGAAALGHTHLDVDDDGVVRAVYLREGQDTQLWPHLAAAMLQLGQAGRVASPPPGAGAAHTSNAFIGEQAQDWRRLGRVIIPFAGPPHHFISISYVDVLEGHIPTEFFRDRYVLVGATAAGIGDLHATPVSSRPGLMPGVELTANVLHGLLALCTIEPLPPLANGLLNALAALAVLLAMAALGPLAALLATLLAIAALPALSAIALIHSHWQFSPAAGMVGIALAYAQWSWQRLNTASRYLVEEFELLRDSTGIGRWTGLHPTPPRGDFLSRRIQALDQAAQHLRDLYRLLNDSLESLPDATLACDPQGHVLLCNASAAALLGQPAQQLVGQPLPTLLQDVRRPGDRLPAIAPQHLAADQGPLTVEAQDLHGRDLLVKLAPSRNAAGQRTGWLVILVDVSLARRAQRQRAEAMRFLGHDIRAPQSSILALLDLRRQDPRRVPAEQLEARVERHARRTLRLADDFIQLLRAQSPDYRIEPHDLAAIVDECLDDAWDAASRRQVALSLDACSAREAAIMADRELIARALSNLIGNAVKFSPPRARVSCAIRRASIAGQPAWEVSIADQGPGISAQDQARLFEPFARGSQSTQADGAGLGLAFVKTVAERHGGEVSLLSPPGRGAIFRVALPAAAPGPEP